MKKPAKLGTRTILVVALLLVLSSAASSELGTPPDQGALVETTDDPRAQRTLEDARKLFDEGRYAEAENLAREILAEVEGVDGEDSLEVAEVLDVLVRALRKNRKSTEPETRRLAERAVRIKEKELGPDHPELASSLHDLGWVLHNKAEFDVAEEVHDRALAIREKALGPEHPDTAQSLIALCCVFRHTGELDRAKATCERGLVIQEKALEPDDPELARSLHMTGAVLLSAHDPEGAKLLFERSLAIQEKVFAPDHPKVAASLQALGVCWFRMGDLARARPLYERALTIQEKTFGPDHKSVADTLTNLGNLLSFAGDYSGARSAYERALTIGEHVFGPDHPSLCGPLNNLGLFLTTTGDYATARTLLERGLVACEQAWGPDSLPASYTLYNLGILSHDIGDFRAALSLTELGLTIMENILGADHPYFATKLVNLGDMLRHVGDYAGATATFERALTLTESTLGPDHPSVGRTLHNFGNLSVALGDYETARAQFQRALTIKEKAFAPDHPEVAESLDRIVRWLVSSGRHAEALPYSERELSIFETAFGPDHLKVAMALEGLARVQLGSGRPTDALDAGLRAEKISRDSVRLTIRSLSERLALAFASDSNRGLHGALSAVAGHPDAFPGAAGRTWDAQIRSRSLVLDEMAQRRRSIIEEGDLDGASLVRELSVACERLAHLTVHGLGKNTPEQYRLLLREASVEKDEAERRLAEKSLPFRAKLTRERLGLSDVRAALPDGSALLAFARYERAQQAEKTPTSSGDGTSGDPDAKEVSWREDVPAYLAFVFRKGQRSPVGVPLGPAAEIEALVSRWGQEMAHGLRAPGWTPLEAETAYREAGEALRKRIWDPVAPHLKESELVLVVPDGALHQVSLTALPAGEEGYLIEEGPLIHYLSAERDVVPKTETGEKEGGILALGAPAFDDASLFAALAPEGTRTEKRSILMAAQTAFRGERSGCGDFESLEFDPLPASGREIDDVLELWEKGRQQKEKTSRLTGAEASETAFKALAPGKAVLHLATHGFFLNGRCPPVALDTQGEEGSRSQQWFDELPPAGENPLLLTGLALAGANNREAAGPDEDDGILTAEEVAALDLSSAEWVILSACDTGIGEVRAGEGLFGLRRAFQIAGAQTLITSLWAVEDEAGHQWMSELYENRFVRGLGTAESVRAASLEVLRQRRAENRSTHPFYWAGFIASGDWR